MEHSGSVSGALDWGSKCCWFQPHRWQIHFSKTLYPLLSTGSNQEVGGRVVRSLQLSEMACKNC